MCNILCIVNFSVDILSNTFKDEALVDAHALRKPMQSIKLQKHFNI